MGLVNICQFGPKDERVFQEFTQKSEFMTIENSIPFVMNLELAKRLNEKCEFVFDSFSKQI